MIRKIRIPIVLVLMIFLVSCAANQITQIKKGLSISQISIKSLQDTTARAFISGQISNIEKIKIANILDKAMLLHNQAVLAAELAEAAPTELNQQSLVAAQMSFNKTMTNLLAVAVEFGLLGGG